METVCPHCGAAARAGDLACRACGCGLEPGSGVSQADQELLRDLHEAFAPVGAQPAGSDALLASNGAGAGVLRGSRLGEFEILSEIGRGGMGVVFRARQSSLGRDVALKVLPGAAHTFRRSMDRFRTEARVIARLNHPNIIPLFGDGESEGNLYYAMALVEGCSLDVAMQQRPELLSSGAIPGDGARTRILPRSETGSATGSTTVADLERVPPARTLADFRHLAAMMADVADGLSHAHAMGVIHRDIKPQNLLVSGDGRVYISDFGLSQLSGEPHLTVTGELMGTPAYLSPEQIQGGAKAVDQRTDIYSLGVTLYELLSGRRPFRGDTRDQLMHRICTAEPVHPQKIDRRIPRDLASICLHAMNKDPQRRYQTAAAMADDLRRFAEGKSIGIAPPGAAARGWGWVRRHRAGSAVIVLTIVAAVLGGGLAVNVRAARQTEAAQLLADAYEQLIYEDYRVPADAEVKIREAETLGADPNELDLVKAVVDISHGRYEKAVDRLQHVLSASPQDIAAMYLLGWAQGKTRDGRSAAAETMARAQALGGPVAADEWFLKALAQHFDQPEPAIAAYQQANALRAAQGKFFPQAVLHLARAYNQRMYATRSDDVYEDAEIILRQLVKQGHYGTFPHYLMSITQRLRGEIMLARGAEDLAANQFESALEWARLGQQVDPSDDRCVTAEAECLERLGMFADAVAARARAIELGNQPAKRCEGYHYRWRLHYWLGDLDGARQDVQAHAACMPESVLYSHVYPAWLDAEAGDVESAVARARELASANPTNPMAVLWSAACLRIVGEAQAADEVLAGAGRMLDFAAGLTPPQTEAWMQALFALAGGAMPVEQVIALAGTFEQSRKLRGEAYFHAAARAFALKNRSQAEELLRHSYLSFDGELGYTFHAKALLVKMEFDSGWPEWIDFAGTNALPD